MKYTILSLVIFLSTIVVFADNATVVAYLPAPGQFVNTLPAATAEDDSVSMASAADAALQKGSMLHLGGFGGYVIAKFPSPISNAVVDDYDFRIFGNAYDGNAEPGVVWVSADDNQNGLPDDTWYELYGSEADRSTRPYSITYYRPSAADDAATGAVDRYIRWRASDDTEGFIPKNTFHKQSYYPLWIDADSITYTGTLLPDNAFDKNGDGSYWVLNAYDYGYADNKPNKDLDGCSFKIEWAHTADGTPANLDRIDFVKVQGGINKINGQIGECSTEITGIESIRELASAVENIVDFEYLVDSHQSIVTFGKTIGFVMIVSVNGQIVATYADTDVVDFSHLDRGVYVCVADGKSLKIIK